MSSIQGQRRRKISPRVKLAFSVGSLEDAMMQAASIATMLFYNQVLGVSAALCGLAFLVASLVDAFSDPLIGAWSDRVQTRWGRRHPFMLLSALPIGLFFYLLYQPPDLSEQGLFVWLLCMLVGARLAKTCFSVPHSALGAELTDDYHERTSIFGWDWVMRLGGAVVLGIFVLFLIFPTTGEYENGLLDPDRYVYLAVMGGILSASAVLTCALATREQLPYLHQQSVSGANALDSFKELWRNLSALLVNPSYIAICLCWLVLAVSAGVIAVVGTYTFVYAFEFSTEQMAARDFVRLPGVFLALLLASYLTRLLDKKYTVIATIVWSTFMIGLPYCLRLLGWLPENGSTALFIAFFGIWLMGFLTLPVPPIVIDSQLVDVADDHELRTGNRAEGLIFSVRTFALKLSQGVGSLIAGVGLELIGFPENASPDQITGPMIDGLLFMMGPLYYVIVLCGVVFAFMYRIDKQRHEEILTLLEKRRGSVAQAEAGRAVSC